MSPRRYGPGISSALALSLLIHGTAVGGLVLSARFLAPDPGGGAAAAADGGSGGIVLVRLLDESAPPSQVLDDGGRSAPAAAARPTPPQPAPTAAREKRPKPRAPAATPLHTGEPAELASAVAAPSPPGKRPLAASGTGASQPVADAGSGAGGRSGGKLARGRAGPENGYEVGRLDRVARPAAPIRPRYPAGARQRGDEADVGVDVWVGAGGEVDRVAVSRSAGDDFDAAAIAAVHRARFHPALRDGEQVASRVALRLHFRLDR